MSKTNIEYGDRTWNPLTGCAIKSEGCVNCWARGMAKRLRAMGRAEYQDAVDDAGNWTGKITLVPERLAEPFAWRKPQHVLVEYMGDLFHEDVPVEYIHRVFYAMRDTSWHLYQTLTKRPENMGRALSNIQAQGNVILGVSIEKQKRADERREYMRALSEMGWRTWVSYEPALGAVDWSGWEFLDQLICGGESGPRARAMHPDWARTARDFCIHNGIPFFFKQWGKWMPAVGSTLSGDIYAPSAESGLEEYRFDDGEAMVKCPLWKWPAYDESMGDDYLGNILDGHIWKEMPKDSRHAE